MQNDPYNKPLNEMDRVESIIDELIHDSTALELNLWAGYVLDEILNARTPAIDKLIIEADLHVKAYKDHHKEAA